MPLLLLYKKTSSKINSKIFFIQPNSFVPSLGLKVNLPLIYLTIVLTPFRCLCPKKIKPIAELPCPLIKHSTKTGPYIPDVHL